MYGWKILDSMAGSGELFETEEEAIKDASKFMLDEEFRDGQTEADIVIFMAVKTIRFKEVSRVKTELLKTFWHPASG